MTSELARDRIKHHDTELKILRIVEELKKNNPGFRFARCTKHNTIGFYCTERQRFVAYIEHTITGHFVQMDYEIKINGELPAHNWIEL